MTFKKRGSIFGHVCVNSYVESAVESAAVGVGAVSTAARIGPPVVGFDPGPLARFAEVTSAENAAQTMSVLVQRLTDGDTLKVIARAWEIPYGRVAEWIVEDRDRSDRYNAALRIWADSLAQESVSIAQGRWEPAMDREGNAVLKDDGTPLLLAPDHKRDGLRVRTNLALAGKWDRVRYGDHSSIAVAVKDDRPFDRESMVLEAARGVAFLLAQGTRLQDERDERDAQRLLTGPVEEATPAAQPGTPAAPDTPQSTARLI